MRFYLDRHSSLQLFNARRRQGYTQKGFGEKFDVKCYGNKESGTCKLSEQDIEKIGKALGLGKTLWFPKISRKKSKWLTK